MFTRLRRRDAKCADRTLAAIAAFTYRCTDNRRYERFCQPACLWMFGGQIRQRAAETLDSEA
ncbi:MAG: hypothetical protein ACRELT_04845, partial [Longimicrobiales bacterium]